MNTTPGGSTNSPSNSTSDTLSDIRLDECLTLKNLYTSSRSKVNIIKQKRTTNTFVVKLYDLDDGFVDKNQLSEVDMLVKLIHIPNVLQVRGVCISNDNLSIITEKMTGDLKHLIKKLGFEDRLRTIDNLIYSMLNVLSVFELHNIYYTDMKSNNILYELNFQKEVDYLKLTPLDSYIFKLCDFEGVRTKASLSDFSGATLTIPYMPPEFSMNTNKGDINPSKCVLWSLGITILEFLVGHHVFYIPNVAGKATIRNNKDVLNQEMWNNLFYDTDSVNSNDSSSKANKHKSQQDSNGNISSDSSNDNNRPNYESFIKNNKFQLFTTERLDVETLIDKNTYHGSVPQKGKLVNILKDMLIFNPNNRKSATNLLKEYYNKDTSNIVIAYDDFTRAIYEPGINIIKTIIQDLISDFEEDEIDEDINNLYLITMELYTRFLGHIKDNAKSIVQQGEEDDFHIEKYILENELKYAALACLNLVSEFIRRSFYFDVDIIFEDEDDFEHHLLIKMIQTVLKTVNFLIYNQKIDLYANDTTIKLSSLFDMENSVYLKPVESWILL